VWERLRAFAEQHASSGGQVLAPQRADGALGADLLTEVPEIARWLVELEPGKRLVLGSYAYADGQLFVRVALAMDCISQLVARHRRGDVALSFLCSPTDAFSAPPAARDDSRARLVALSPLTALRAVLHPALGIMRANYEEQRSSSGVDVVESFVLQQGPNYALAKRVQHWRAVADRAEGRRVSSNVGPAASTESVTKNALLAAGYAGASFFPPIEIFEPRTANHVMALLLVRDAFDERAPASPHTKLRNPLDLFTQQAVHGGMFRMPYKLRSVLELAVVLYYLRRAAPAIAVASAGALAMRQHRAKL
jgi:hypothetical protein